MFINPRYSDKNKGAGVLITQPNQAFTPRQIIEQFARNEIVPSMYSPTDSLDDEHFTDEELLSDNVIEFNDKIDAEAHLIENQYRIYEEKQTTNSVRDGSQEASNETDAANGSSNGNSTQ